MPEPNKRTAAVQARLARTWLFSSQANHRRRRLITEQTQTIVGRMVFKAENVDEPVQKTANIIAGRDGLREKQKS